MCVLQLRSIAWPEDLSNRAPVLDSVEDTVGDVGAGDGEAERGQMADAKAVLAGVGLVAQLGRADHGPVQPAGGKDLLHRRRIHNNAGEEHTADEVRRRNDRVAEKKRGRLYDGAPDAGVAHGAGQGGGEAL